WDQLRAELTRLRAPAPATEDAKQVVIAFESALEIMRERREQPIAEIGRHWVEEAIRLLKTGVPESKGTPAPQWEEALRKAAEEIHGHLDALWVSDSVVCETVTILRRHLPQPDSEDKALLDWAISHPEASMNSINLYWATAGRGCREIAFNFRLALEEAR